MMHNFIMSRCKKENKKIKEFALNNISLIKSCTTAFWHLVEIKILMVDNSNERFQVLWTFTPQLTSALCPQPCSWLFVFLLRAAMAEIFAKLGSRGSADGASPTTAEDQYQSDGTSPLLFPHLPAIGRDWREGGETWFWIAIWKGRLWCFGVNCLWRSGGWTQPSFWNAILVSLMALCIATQVEGEREGGGTRQQRQGQLLGFRVVSTMIMR